MPLRVAGDVTATGATRDGGDRAPRRALRCCAPGAARARVLDILRSVAEPPPIRAVISDFGGVLTTPLIDSFAAFQDQTGIPAEALGRAMQAIAERDGAHPLYELETRRG